MLKKILFFLLIVLVVIQFFHPKKNTATGAQPHSIQTVFAIPPDVKIILEKACNDCHTNNTRYPWYSRVQPVDWWLDNHVRDGKKHLNLDEYTSRSLRYQYHKLEEIAEQTKSGEMPLNSYTWLHTDARLTAAEKDLLINWADKMRDSMRAVYPLDSLERRKNP